MTIVGITGGIGSGKTTIANYFKTFGIPVYVADTEAKALMHRSKIIRRKLIQLFGEDAYVNDQLNRPYLASKIFNDKSLLSKMNAIVHPKVGKHFQRWVQKQNAPYVLKEVAIIFENKLQTQYNYIITVVADKDERIKRVLQRENTSEEKIKAIINNQLPDDYKIKHSDFVITNNHIETAKQESEEIHHKILKLIHN